LINGGRAPRRLEVPRQRAQCGRTLLASEQCRKRRYAHRLAAELLDLEPEAFELRSMRGQGVTAPWRQLENHRFKQALTLQPASHQSFGDALEEHALMRDM